MRWTSRMVVGIAIVASGARAQTDHPTVRSSGIVVRCKTQAGEAVPNATIHVFQRQPAPDGTGLYRQFGPFESGADGRIHCPIALTYGGRRFDRFVYARAPGTYVGIARALQANEFEADQAPGTIDVVMCPSRRVRGTVRVPAGKDPTAVRVHVLSVYALDGVHVSGGTDFGSGFPRRSSGFRGLEHALPEVFESRVDEDGGFVLDDIPTTARLYLAADGAGLGQAQWANIPRGPDDEPSLDEVELVMAEQAVLAGRVVTASGSPLAKAVVTARIVDGPNIFVTGTFEASTDERGAFGFEGVPRSVTVDLRVTAARPESSITVGDAPEDTWTFRPQRVSLAKMGSPDLDLELEHGAIVSGHVIDAVDGKPIVGASLAAVSTDLPSASLGTTRSGEDGEFALRLPAGTARLYFSGIPSAYRYPEPQIVQELDLEDRREVRGLRLVLERREQGRR